MELLRTLHAQIGGLCIHQPPHRSLCDLTLLPFKFTLCLNLRVTFLENKTGQLPWLRNKNNVNNTR